MSEWNPFLCVLTENVGKFWGWRCGLVGKCLPGRREAPGSSPSTACVYKVWRFRSVILAPGRRRQEKFKIIFYGIENSYCIAKTVLSQASKGYIRSWINKGGKEEEVKREREVRREGDEINQQFFGPLCRENTLLCHQHFLIRSHKARSDCPCTEGGFWREILGSLRNRSEVMISYPLTLFLSQI